TRPRGTSRTSSGSSASPPAPPRRRLHSSTASSDLLVQIDHAAWRRKLADSPDARRSAASYRRSGQRRIEEAYAMESTEHTDVLFIGADQPGLALVYPLQQRGLQTVLLDRNAGMRERWRN